MTWLRQIISILGKDLLLEWRSPVRLSGLFFFAFALLLLIAFASNTTDVMRKVSGGALWIGLVLASTRSFDLSFAAEFEQGAMEGMVLWPVHPIALYYGKAIANWVVLLLVALAMTPLVIAIYDVPVQGSVVRLLLFVMLGCGALAAPGTFFALITAQARGASVLLPILLFPLILPAVLAASRGTTLVFEGDPMGQSQAWLGMLIAINAMHWTVSGLFFGLVVEE